MKRVSLALLMAVCGAFLCSGQSVPSLTYPNKDIAGLVGNGLFLSRTSGSGYHCVRGSSSSYDFAGDVICVGSSFFPGGVEYSYSDGSRVLYGADKSGMIAVVCGRSEELDGFTLVDRKAFDEEKQKLYLPYSESLVIDTPDETLNLSVEFSQYLLDLGFNGEFMLCELFRWLDIWARDLGSGLLPGSLASGRAVPGRMSLEYDLRRYAKCRPSDCKNTNDPSQGGTAEAVGWTVRSIWNYYMYSGDKDCLRADMDIVRPWVEFWCRRDYDEDGLIIDVTEFMDHMIMMLTTQGVSTLAASTMFASMLTYSSRIERELGNLNDAVRYERLYDRTVNALNTVFWNEEKGYFNNMVLWGDVSERSAQASQSMLLKIGATDVVRSKRTLDYLKSNNWVDFGSLTITPAMNHVPLSNDQNMNVWPWWNLWEAEARFNLGDAEGGYKLLSLAASTIKDEKYPGLMEENFDLSGTTYGGNAFPTAAGNLLEVVVKDLFGIQAMTPGWKDVKVVPNVPKKWKSYSCKAPVPGGFITLVVKNGKKTVLVESDVVKTVHVENETKVEGADKSVYANPVRPVVRYEQVVGKELPDYPKGRAAQFFDNRIHSEPLYGVGELVDIDGLISVDTSQYTHLVINGNTLPKQAKEALERFVQRGGQVIFFGATANAKNENDGAGLIGEQCGIVDWIDYLPSRDKSYMHGWKQSVNEYRRFSDFDYTAAVDIPLEFKGKDLYLELGPLTGLDSVFVNDSFVGSFRDIDSFRYQEYPAATDYPNSNEYMRVSRMYIIPADSQSFIRFGSSNDVKIKIRRDVCKEGLTERNRPNIGVLSGNMAWQFIDEDVRCFAFEFPKRKGVNYWGNEQFFNSWSTKQGLFGIRKHGQGVSFVEGTVLSGLPFKDIEVDAVYTDFAVFAPMDFEVLAYTATAEHLLYPMHEEHYPCAVRVVHNELGGAYIIVAPALAKGSLGEEILSKLLK